MLFFTMRGDESLKKCKWESERDGEKKRERERIDDNGELKERGQETLEFMIFFLNSKGWEWERL